MNFQSSPKEVLRDLLSTTAGSQPFGFPLIRRLAPAIAIATTAFAVSACTSMPSENVGKTGASSGITVLSIRADDSREFPSNGEFSFPNSREVIGLANDPETDYLTSILNDLPWLTP